jgi:integrase
MVAISKRHRRKRNFVKVGIVKIPWCKLSDGRTYVDLRSIGQKPFTFTDHSEAIEEAERIARERNNDGAGAMSFTASDRAMFREAVKRVNGLDLLRVVDAGVAALTKTLHPTADVVRELLPSFEGKHKGYAHSMRRTWEEFVRQYPGDIGSIRMHDIEAFLDSWVEKKKVGPRRRNNLLREIRQLFQGAKIRGYLPDGITEARKVSIIARIRTNIGVVSPELMRLFLDKVSEEWLPWMCIAAFSGIRTDEIILDRNAASWKDPLKWDDFDWRNREICIRVETSKTGIARRVPISDNLLAWLEAHVDAKGYVCPPGGQQWRPDNERRRILAVLKKEEPKDAKGNPIAVDYPDNAFRHSYISNRLAIVRSMAQVAIECGTSESRIKANYNSPRPLSEAQAYFAIFPNWSVRNAIRFPAS